MATSRLLPASCGHASSTCAASDREDAAADPAGECDRQQGDRAQPAPASTTAAALEAGDAGLQQAVELCRRLLGDAIDHGEAGIAQLRGGARIDGTRRAAERAPSCRPREGQGGVRRRDSPHPVRPSGGRPGCRDRPGSTAFAQRLAGRFELPHQDHELGAVLDAQASSSPRSRRSTRSDPSAGLSVSGSVTTDARTSV